MVLLLIIFMKAGDKALIVDITFSSEWYMMDSILYFKIYSIKFIINYKSKQPTIYAPCLAANEYSWRQNFNFDTRNPYS